MYCFFCPLEHLKFVHLVREGSYYVKVWTDGAKFVYFRKLHVKITGLGKV